MRSIAVFAAALLAGACSGLLPSHRSPSPVHAPAVCRTAVAQTGSPAILDWVQADAATDRLKLDEWCRTVGPGIVVQSSPIELPPPRLDDLAIASWNIEVGGGEIDTLLDRLRDPAHPNRPIVVLLQEAYRDGPLVPPLHSAARVPRRIAPAPPSGFRTSVVETAERRGLSLFYVPSMRNGGADRPATAEDRGNAILSSLPLSDLMAIELPFEHQRRVAVAASVRVLDPAGRESKLHVVSAHLDARASWRRGSFFWFGRMRQARALLEAIGGLPPPTTLGGDFNSWLGDLEPDVREARSRFRQTPSSDAHVTFPLLGRLGFHLDHLFFSLADGWRADVSTLNQQWGSDHYPIVGSFRAPPPPVE